MPDHRQPDELPITSSFPTREPKEQVDLFRDVLSTLEDSSIPFSVSGAFALRRHTGICRVTKDLDLFLTARNAPVALTRLRNTGLECEITDPVWLHKARRGEHFVDLITGMSNGLLVVDDSWIQRSCDAVVYGVKTRVLAPEELVASKLFVARRERFDGADIAHIIYGTYGCFDWDRMMELVGEHWEMMLWALVLYRYVYPAQSHHVPQDVWQTLLGKFESVTRAPQPTAAFRGSLVDDRMFAIDVNEWRLANLLEESRNARLAQIDAEQKYSLDCGEPA